MLDRRRLVKVPNYRLYKINGQAISVVGDQTAATLPNGMVIPVQNIKVTSGGTGVQQATFQSPDVTAAGSGLAAGDRIVTGAWINCKKVTGFYGSTLHMVEKDSGGTQLQAVNDFGVL
jgi:hypothetical protein